MNAVLQLEARPRETGSRASRRLRQAGFVPGIIYGPGVEPLAISVPTIQLERLVDRHGRTQQAVLAYTEAMVAAGVADGSVRGSPV